MRKRKDGTHFKELLRQFYQIHQGLAQQLKQSHQNQSNSAKKIMESGEQSNQQQEQDLSESKQKLMKTTSTQIFESKIRNWEQQTLRQIQQKSQGEQNSNECQNSIQKYAFRQKQPSPSSKRQQKSYLQQKYQSKSKSRKAPKCKKGGNNKSQAVKKQSKLIVALKYEHDKNKSNTYHIEMKMLNKQWLKTLDNIHRNL